MFNGPFNRLPFNRYFSADLTLTATFESTSGMGARLSVEFPVTVVFESASQLSQTMTREISFKAAMESATETVARMMKDVPMGARFSSASAFNVAVTYSHVSQISYTGALKPGDRLVIDTKRKTVTLNGQNVLHLMDGDFFELISGVNTLSYTDTAATRNVLTRITHRDKYLY